MNASLHLPTVASFALRRSSFKIHTPFLSLYKSEHSVHSELAPSVQRIQFVSTPLQSAHAPLSFTYYTSVHVILHTPSVLSMWWVVLHSSQYYTSGVPSLLVSSEWQYKQLVSVQGVVPSLLVVESA
jgi:hypothetical protein